MINQYRKYMEYLIYLYIKSIRIFMKKAILSSEIIMTSDTIYVISGNNDLLGSTIKVPEGCELFFKKGAKIRNGIIELNNTRLSGEKHCIATKVSGYQDELDTDFFDLTADNKSSIMQSIVNTSSIIQLHGRFENVFDNIQLGGKEITIIGNGAIISNSVSNPAITITTNDFVRIVDIDFQINTGYAIYKNVAPTTVTKLSFIIDRCRFVSTGDSSTSIIQLLGSREGNITNCFFEGTGKSGSIGINRTDAVNTNVISCMFSNLSYGIKAMGLKTDLDPSSEQYSIFACGLNVQSAVMLGCKYGIFIEGNDSFFLNNSMIDYCDNPLVVISQDGANITNNYFSTSSVYNDYAATITIINNTSKGTANRNKRIIVSGNTIYGHRTINNHAIDLDVESLDCIIQNNTLDFYTDYGVYLRHINVQNGWTTEKLVIDNNRFYFAYDNAKCIGGYSGGFPIIISNNYVIEGTNTSFFDNGNPYFGNYLYSGNHDYLYGGEPSNPENKKIYYASRRNNTRMKIGLTFNANQYTMSIDNPMHQDTSLVVYIANNRYPICVDSITSQSITFTKTVSDAVVFTAIIEHILNL